MSGTQSPPPGNRAVSPVAGTRTPIFTQKRAVGVLLAVVLVVAACAIWKMQNPTVPPPKSKMPAKLGQVTAYQAPGMPVAPVTTPENVPEKKPEATPAATGGLAKPDRDPLLGNLNLGAMRGTTPAMVVPVRKPYMLSYGGEAKPVAAGGDGKPEGPITYAASRMQGQSAVPLGDGTFRLMPGIVICILDTAIDSTFAGPIQCHTPGEVRRGGVTLMGRGTIIRGSYSNTLQSGQRRLAVAAVDAWDPATECYVQFANDPFVEANGAVGVPGNVDNHWWERFGAAFLLTGGQTAANILQAAVSKGGNTYLDLNGSGGASGLASEILRASVGQPPTIAPKQGDMIGVYIGKPLDFSKCYDLKLKGR